LAAPTAAEIAAGVDLVGSKQAEELSDLQGWRTDSDVLPTPGYAGTTVGNVAGDETYPASSFTWYKDSVSATIYSAIGTAVSTGADRWVIIMWEGATVGEETEVFPVRVTSRVRDPARNVPHTFTANYALDTPVVGVVAA
jgi:hypothetical protein